MSSTKESIRARRKLRIKKKIQGTPDRPRLSVFRSVKHIYAQLIDDVSGKTILQFSSKISGFEGSGGNIEGAKKVGLALAERALEKGYDKIVFDRNGYLYHGRVKALAEAAREKGLNF